MAALTSQQIDGLQAEVRGRVIGPDDSEFNAARRVWNGMIDRRPAVIVRCRGVGDVVAGVNFARESGLPVAIRGGGHNAAGNAVGDDALVIDLSEMRAVFVDPREKRALVQGGATWADYDRETQLFGLASTGGAISTTGVAGLTLGGGIGWLQGRCGLAADNLIGAQVVTAGGDIVWASESQNPELLWGLRGGGGNFGVVTGFEFRLHDVGPMITGGMAAHPMAKAREAIAFYRDLTAGAPDDLTAFCGLTAAPDGTPIVAHLVCHSGSLSDGEQAVAPIKAFGPPIVDLIGPMPYVAQQKMLDDAFPSGRQVYWKGAFLGDLTDELIDVLAQRGEEMPSASCALVIEHLHGAVTRVAPDATAFANRDAKFNLAIVAQWTDGADRDRHYAWARKVFDSIQPYATGGAYVNYLGVDDTSERVPSAFGPNLARLAALKRQYDPQNLFRFNQNVAPA